MAAYINISMYINNKVRMYLCINDMNYISTYKMRSGGVKLRTENSIFNHLLYVEKYYKPKICSL